MVPWCRFSSKQRENKVLPVTDTRMTRFIITLEQGADFVLKSLERMSGGEVFVPKIPSTNILDIAKAIAPECEIKIVGIRPGEKIHETMVPVEEARQTIEMDDHFVITPAVRTLEPGRRRRITKATRFVPTVSVTPVTTIRIGSANSSCSS